MVLELLAVVIEKRANDDIASATRAQTEASRKTEKTFAAGVYTKSATGRGL